MGPVRQRAVGWVGASLLAGLVGCRAEPVPLRDGGIDPSGNWKVAALTADVLDDADRVWASVCRTMSSTTEALLEVDEDHRRLETRVDEAEVTVHVVPSGGDETRIYVEAQKYMLHNPEIAQLVMKRLVDDLRD